ncbi:hypothetical protein M077_0354 [Bacteroides fragilis str. 2-F-2 |nr:hypothetical protein M077_0354 [Bacteroides fragilis str. 2-F-2 \
MGIERFDIAEGGKYLNDMAFPFEASKINAFRSYKLFSSVAAANERVDTERPSTAKLKV